jgi:hypothetical protein
MLSYYNNGLRKICRLGKHHFQIIEQGITQVDLILDQDVKMYSQIDVKKDACHFALVIKVLRQHFFPRN